MSYDRSITAPNAHRLLWAGFMAILAAGVGFAIRGGILDNWGAEFGFTNAQLGEISGQGLTGFCIGIIVGGIIVDKIGYNKLVIAAFAFHIISAFVTFAAVKGTSPEMAYNYLYWGTFIFAVANGTLEAVANPLVATLFPHNRTHYLNILHASWPAGLVLGGALGWILDDQLKFDWKIQLALYIIPVLVYGMMFLGQGMPKSEASAKGLSLGEMLKDVGLLGGLVACFFLSLFFGGVVLKPLFTDPVTASYVGYGIGAVLLVLVGIITKFSIGSVLLFVLFLTHALVGAVELGTDGWIQNITGNLLSSSEGKILFVFTSALMFSLRFCADFIEKKIGLSPIGLLLVCSIAACIGLNLTSRVETFGFALLAAAVYGFGKTFFWPTMLAVASDRFPRSGAIAISIMGGIGMMSAGLIGSPGLGYLKDKYAGEALQSTSPELYSKHQNEKPSEFLFFPKVVGLDGKKLKEVTDQLGELRKNDPKTPISALSPDDATLLNASITGDRKTLVTDSLIPGTMAVIYFGLMLYFLSVGGYKVLSINDSKRE